MDEKKILKIFRFDGVMGAIGFVVFLLKPILFGLISNEVFKNIYRICSTCLIILFLCFYLIQIKNFRKHITDEREFETVSYAAVNTLQILIPGIVVIGCALSILLKLTSITVDSSEVASFFESLFFALISVFSFSYLYYTEDPEDLDDSEDQ